MAVNTQWRPSWRPGEASDTTQLAFRKLFDFVYSQQSQQGPAVVSASPQVGTPAVVIVPTVAQQQYGSGIGLLVTLSRPGTWAITGTAALNITTDSNIQFQLLLVTGGIPQAARGLGQLSGDGTIMLTQSWTVTVAPAAAPVQYVLQVVKASGTGTSSVDPLHSSLIASWSGS